MTAVLERVAKAVDWDRLLMEAYWRHSDLHEGAAPKDRYQPTTADVCGECLREALLCERRGAPDWEREPNTPLTHQKTDWPTIVAKELEHRDASHWHPYKD
jgi:hypothetical protein